jgi:DNA-directed RNA polymerase, beta subunit/140 kD subunit
VKSPGGQNLVFPLSTITVKHTRAVIRTKRLFRGPSGRSAFIRTYNAENKRFPGGQEERIEVPGYGASMKSKGLKSWGFLLSSGKETELPVPETELTSQEGGRSILVGKTSPPRFLERITRGIPAGPGTEGVLYASSSR